MDMLIICRRLEQNGYGNLSLVGVELMLLDVYVALIELSSRCFYYVRIDSDRLVINVDLPSFLLP
jgi:hypothetical protein